jgi:hypothetical protein
MSNIKRFFNILLTLNAVILVSNADIPYKSFDESMSITKNHKKSHDYIVLEKIYEKNNPSVLGDKKRNTIPKIIHQIWLGPKQIPAKHQENSNQWRALHPDWEYKLWTEKDIENWDFSSKDLFNRSSSYQEQADLLRYEVLIKYGGLYLDFDYQPFKSLDEVHSKYDFYGTTEPIAENADIVVTDALVGSVPNHKIFIETLKDIRSHWDSEEEKIKHFAPTKERHLIHIGVNRCMIPFGKSVLRNIDSKNSIVFPTSYMGIVIRDNFLSKIRKFFRMQKRSSIVFEETMAGQMRGESLMSNLQNIHINEPWHRKLLKQIQIFT